MKTKLLAIFIAIIFCMMLCMGCGSSTPPNDNSNTNEAVFETINFEGCEYVWASTTRYPATEIARGFGYMAHKGNCTNPIHCHNQ